MGGDGFIKAPYGRRVVTHTRLHVKIRMMRPHEWRKIEIVGPEERENLHFISSAHAGFSPLTNSRLTDKQWQV